MTSSLAAGSTASMNISPNTAYRPWSPIRLSRGDVTLATSIGAGTLAGAAHRERGCEGGGAELARRGDTDQVRAGVGAHLLAVTAVPAQRNGAGGRAAAGVGAED